jgi:magnesium transporter
MMTFYGLRQGRLVRLDHASASGLPASADVLWIDLFDPLHKDERAVETLLGLAVPTRQEMAEIEESARLYEERGALVMTAVVINGAAEGRPSRAQVTFVLTPTHLVSVRYADPVPFAPSRPSASASPRRTPPVTASWSRSWRASSSAPQTSWSS